MVSTFHGLELGKRGLMAGQASIATTGHNIANATTKGYSRQQVNTVTSTVTDVWTTGSVNPGQLGSGVSIDSIVRVRDRFLDQQYRDQSGTLGQWQAKQATFDRLETVVNEPSDTGLNAAMNQLAGAWQDLANDSSSASAQAVVKERGQAFVEVAQSMDGAMAALKTDIAAQTKAAAEEANAYLQQIADLNESIKRSGAQANDLLDQRDMAVEELSKLAAVNVKEEKGMYTISLRKADGSHGTELVKGWNVEAKIEEGSEVTGGKLKGLDESKEIVEQQHTDLTKIVNDFAAANGNLFTGNGSAIADLQVDYNANPLTLAKNSEKDIQTVKSSYQVLVSQLGAKSQSAVRSVANFEATLQGTENRRQSVTGVSLDEEMANLVKFQHSYSAAARLVSTTDQMLDTIINRMAAR